MKHPLHDEGRIATSDPGRHTTHALHQVGRVWRETNCYTDVWIEILHALGHPPEAMLGPCLRVTVEADQWTFFKPSFDDLYALFGLDVVETNPWRGLLATCTAAVASGRIAIPEVDSWFLPDTAGVSYRIAHVKSSIAVLAIDESRRHLSYAHNAGRYELSGDDFDGLFGLGTYACDATHLPPYVDMCTPSNGFALSPSAIADTAFDLLCRGAQRISMTNPFVAWATRFDGELDDVRSGGDDAFHAYAFTTFRQFGPAFELAAAHLTWLAEHASISLGEKSGLVDASAHFTEIASTALVFQMRTARAVMSGKPLDPTVWTTSMADEWQAGTSIVRALASAR